MHLAWLIFAVLGQLCARLATINLLCHSPKIERWEIHFALLTAKRIVDGERELQAPVEEKQQPHHDGLDELKEKGCVSTVATVLLISKAKEG